MCSMIVTRGNAYISAAEQDLKIRFGGSFEIIRLLFFICGLRRSPLESLWDTLLQSETCENP